MDLGSAWLGRGYEVRRVSLNRGTSVGLEADRDSPITAATEASLAQFAPGPDSGQTGA